MITENIQKIIDTCPRIGVFVSGGFDSGLLLYLLHLYRKDNVIEIYVVERHPKSVEHAMSVITFIESKFEYKSEIKVLRNDRIDSKKVMSGVGEVLKNLTVDKLLVGDVSPPSHLNSSRLYKSNNIIVEQPFYEYTKDVLVQIAKDLSILELLDVTNSCELSYKNPCMKCFHCLEKDWAIKTVMASPGGIEPPS